MGSFARVPRLSELSLKKKEVKREMVCKSRENELFTYKPRNEICPTFVLQKREPFSRKKMFATTDSRRASELQSDDDAQCNEKRQRKEERESYTEREKESE